MKPLVRPSSASPDYVYVDNTAAWEAAWSTVWSAGSTSAWCGDWVEVWCVDTQTGENK